MKNSFSDDSSRTIIQIRYSGIWLLFLHFANLNYNETLFLFFFFFSPAKESKRGGWDLVRSRLQTSARKTSTDQRDIHAQKSARKICVCLPATRGWACVTPDETARIKAQHEWQTFKKEKKPKRGAKNPNKRTFFCSGEGGIHSFTHSPVHSFTV